MKDQLQVIRDFFKLPVPHRPQDLGEYIIEQRKAIAALTQIEVMVGAQEPVQLDHIACIDGGELRYMTRRKAPAYDCELYAMPDGKRAPKLYAAPVAQQPQGEVVVTWDEHRTRILAVTRQDREGRILSVIAEAPAQQPQADTPQATTIAEAARDVGKWLNERPNRPIDLRHVAMLVAHAMQPQAEAVPNVCASFYTESAELIGTTEAPIKRVEREDDGTLHVYIDHWPQQAEAVPVAVVKYQVGGLTVHIVGDVQEGDELFKTPQQVWQPIETAPTEPGVEYLVYTPGAMYPYDVCRNMNGFRIIGNTFDFDRREQPTMWMPITPAEGLK